MIKALLIWLLYFLWIFKKLVYLQELILGCFPGSSQDRVYLFVLCILLSILLQEQWWEWVSGTWSGVFSVGTVNWGIPFLNFEGILGLTGLFVPYFQLNFKIVSQNNKTEYCLSLFSWESLFGAASPGQGDNGS